MVGNEEERGEKRGKEEKEEREKGTARWYWRGSSTWPQI